MGKKERGMGPKVFPLQRGPVDVREQPMQPVSDVRQGAEVLDIMGQGGTDDDEAGGTPGSSSSSSPTSPL